MLQKAFPLLAALALLLLFFSPMILEAGQLLGVSQDNPDWSDWKSAPNFPGIKIRVLCGTYLQSTGNAQWSFQFQNTYSKKIYLAYQEETGSSTGAPPTFSTPGARNLGPGQKSDIYTAYLRGTCESRKQIFIRIVSVSDDQGKQTRARPGVSGSGAFNAPSQSNSAAVNRSPGQAGQSQSMPNLSSGAAPLSQSAPGGGASTASVATTSGNTGGLAGSVWTCQVRFTETIENQFGRNVRSYQHDPKVSFSADGTAQITDYSGFTSVRWKQSGRDITILLGESVNYDLEGALDGPGLITGRIAFIRYPNVNRRSSPNSLIGSDYYEGSFTCKR